MTEDKRLLEHALKAFELYNQSHPNDDESIRMLLSKKIISDHGVTYNETAKLGALIYLFTGNKKYLKATINGYNKIDKDQMLIDGIHSATERLRGKDPLDSHETCDIADYTWSVGYLLQATGDPDYADKIERACFNAAPGAVKKDFKALQYFSCPNQVIADKYSNHNVYHCGESWMSYRPNPGSAECCPGAVNRVMPNYISRMWMTTKDNGLAATLYGPSCITIKLGKSNKAVTVIEETNYPFSDRIDFQFRTDGLVFFPFTFRIPGWCKSPKVLLNGTPLAVKLQPKQFITLNRTFANNDRLTLILPMELRLSYWQRGGVGIERGPLVYSLKIKENWRVDKTDKRSTKDFPAWNLYPASPWNYTLAVNKQNLKEAIKIKYNPITPEPWLYPPIELQVPARRVNGWILEKRKKTFSEKLGMIKGNFNFTPQLPEPEDIKDRLSKKVEMVTLVPYGCTHLRLTIFPQR